jgi:hypothetical protein
MWVPTRRAPVSETTVASYAMSPIVAGLSPVRTSWATAARAIDTPTRSRGRTRAATLNTWPVTPWSADAFSCAALSRSRRPAGTRSAAGLCSPPPA